MKMHQKKAWENVSRTLCHFQYFGTFF